MRPELRTVNRPRNAFLLLEFSRRKAEPVTMSVAVVIENPGDELLTLEEFAAFDFGQVAELENAKVKLRGNNIPDHSEVLGNLTVPIKSFVQSNNLGKVFVGDVTVLVRRGPDTGRGIDLAFASHERLKAQPVGVSALHIAPELAVEIMSPSNSWDDVMEKITEYFEIGVREVWVISIRVRLVTVFRAPTESKGYALAQGGSLSCPDIFGAFELPLSQIFAGLPQLEKPE